jgi:hypothetical protein
MPCLVTNRRKAAARALLQLANSDKPNVERYHLRNRSKLNQPKNQNCTKISGNATIDHIIAAATVLDHQTRKR